MPFVNTASGNPVTAPLHVAECSEPLVMSEPVPMSAPTAAPVCDASHKPAPFRRAGFALTCGAALLSLALLGAGKAMPVERVASSITRSSPAEAARKDTARRVAAREKAPPVSPAADEWGELLRDASPSADARPQAAMAPVATPATVSAKRVRVIRMEVTAYCPCSKCCGPLARGVTASGRSVRHNGGRFVAADTGVLPFGTQLLIPGYHNDRPVEVIDRGGAIKGRKLDVYFPTHRQALEWGRQWLPVTVVE